MGDSIKKITGDGGGVMLWQGPLQGTDRLPDGKNHSVCIRGAYAFRGVPFFEGHVVNAKNIVVQGILHCGGTEMQELWIV